jgi:hypothetical protein
MSKIYTLTRSLMQRHHASFPSLVQARTKSTTSNHYLLRAREEWTSTNIDYDTLNDWLNNCISINEQHWEKMDREMESRYPLSDINEIQVNQSKEESNSNNTMNSMKTSTI